MSVRQLLMTAMAAAAATLPMGAAAAGSDADPHSSVVTEQLVKLSVHVDKATAQVADPIHLTVEVEAPRGTRIEMPQLPKQLGDFDVRVTDNVRDIPSAASAETRRWMQHATLDTIKTGTLTIPALDVQFADDAKATTFKTLHSEPIQIRIASVLEDRADPAKFRDIKDTVDLAVPEIHSHAWIGWTAGCVAAATALALLVLLAVKRRRGPTSAAWALGEIAELERLPIANAGDAESIFHEVVDIVREFFGLEFNVRTLSRTSREFLSQATKEVRLSESPRKRLASLVSLADEIKFARRGVGEQQAHQALETAKAFINECELHRHALERTAG